MTHTERILGRFTRVAGPYMAAIRPRNTCIAQARVVVECLRRWGVRAAPLAVKLAIQLPEQHFAYISGFSAAEKAEMLGQGCIVTDRHDPDRTPEWSGHVITVAGGRWFVDPALDQASSQPHGVAIEPGIVAFPLPHGMRPRDAVVDGTLLTSAGPARLHYRPLRAPVPVDSEAWRDPQLLLIAEMICAAMRHDKL